MAAADAKHKKPSLLDIADYNGNTPLHWAAAHRNVSMVGMSVLTAALSSRLAGSLWRMARQVLFQRDLTPCLCNSILFFVFIRLLLHGASVTARNKAGQTPYDLVQWDEREDDDADSNGDSSKLVNGGPSKGKATAAKDAIYSSLTHTYERMWGTPDGLRVEQCSYAGESDAAAIRRLIFQRQLFQAVEAGDDGDEPAVSRLVAEWKRERDEGHKRMWPLVYRADVDDESPIQSAVFMANQEAGNRLLALLLQLPHALHVQSQRELWAALPLAVDSSNIAAVDQLLNGQSDSPIAHDRALNERRESCPCAH